MIVINVCDVTILKISATSSASVVGGNTTNHQFSLFKANRNAFASAAPINPMNRIMKVDELIGNLAKLIAQANRNMPTTSNTTNMRRYE